MNPNVIAHVDMDAFYASIEQRDNPQLLGRPVMVGADPKKGNGRGVVAACSYEARQYGIHSAMPINTAYRLCPSGVFLPVRMERYKEVSDQIFKIFYDFTPDIEPISIDEAFLDLTGSFHFYKTPTATCLKIKERIKNETQLTASIGIAPVKMAAKIASDLCKPNGLLEVKQEGLLNFLWPLSIDKLWGVGPKTKEAFNDLGIKTIGDLAHFSFEELCQKFGEHGRQLYELANGLDDREVAPPQEVKSVSHEHTFEQDTANIDVIHATLLSLSEQVSRRLRKDHLKGKTLTIKIRLKGFQTFTRAFTFSERTNYADTIYQKTKELFDEFAHNSKPIRLLGVRMSHFEDLYVQDSLFEHKDERQEKVHQAVDLIKDKFGEGAIHRGNSSA